MRKPRPLKVEKEVKLIFVGGFLGSGKTTALAAQAKGLLDRGLRVGIITNDQTENLVDTIIVKEMLKGLGVPVEEVVKGCFCCKFDELIDEVEKILVHKPDVLLGEPVGSCTDFVAAVANPIKIHYQEAFRFAPFTTLIDPHRVRELLLGEKGSAFPEEVAYLFKKQLEEADIIVLNKSDLLNPEEVERLTKALRDRFPEKSIRSVSAKTGLGMMEWLDELLSGRPGSNTVLGELDYDRYAQAEAVLGWLNGAISLTAQQAPAPFDARILAARLAVDLREAFKKRGGEIGHLKFVITSSGKTLWTNLTHIDAEPVINGEDPGRLSRGTLILNARVKLEPEVLEGIVRERLEVVLGEEGIRFVIDELQCFSPAYPQPPYLVREEVTA
jgi:G3E family GTPase